MFSLESLVHIIIYLIVAGLILFLLNWLIDYCEVKDPFRKVAKILLAVFSVLIIIGLLLNLAGMPIVRF